MNAKYIDRLLLLTGFGSWVLSALSIHLIGWVGIDNYITNPTFLSNWLLLAATISAMSATCLLIVRLAKLQLLSMPLLAGFAGASLLAAYLVLAGFKWLRWH